MKNKIVIFVLVSAFLLSAFAATAAPVGTGGIYSKEEVDLYISVQTEDRLRETKEYVELGIISEKAREKAIHFSQQAYDHLMAMARAIKNELDKRGALTVGSVAKNKEALEALRKAAVNALAKSMGTDEKNAGAKVDSLIENCGCLPDLIDAKKIELMSQPLKGLPQNYEAPVTAT